jgi:hypothetical protein
VVTSRLRARFGPADRVRDALPGPCGVTMFVAYDVSTPSRGRRTRSGGKASQARTLSRVAAFEAPAPPSAAVPEYQNTSPPEPVGPRYSARVALSCERGHAPGQVLHALQELRSVIDDRLRSDLGGRYDRHRADSVGTDKLTVTFTLRAGTHADAIRSAGLAAGTLAELLATNGAAVDLSGVALVVRAQ